MQHAVHRSLFRRLSVVHRVVLTVLRPNGQVFISSYLSSANGIGRFRRKSFHLNNTTFFWTYFTLTISNRWTTFRSSGSADDADDTVELLSKYREGGGGEGALGGVADQSKCSNRCSFWASIGIWWPWWKLTLPMLPFLAFAIVRGAVRHNSVVVGYWRHTSVRK